MPGAGGAWGAKGAEVRKCGGAKVRRCASAPQRTNAPYARHAPYAPYAPLTNAFVITMMWHGCVASAGSTNGLVPDSVYPSLR